MHQTCILGTLDLKGLETLGAQLLSLGHSLENKNKKLTNMRKISQIKTMKI